MESNYADLRYTPCHIFVINRWRISLKITSPARLFDTGWSFPINIFTANSHILPDTYLDECIAEALIRNIAVFIIDFANHDSVEDAFGTEQAQQASKAIKATNNHTVVILNNADVLAPLDCAQAYTLRTAIDTNHQDPLMYIFIAKEEALHNMFCDERAPFYQSNFVLI